MSEVTTSTATSGIRLYAIVIPWNLCNVDTPGTTKKCPDYRGVHVLIFQGSPFYIYKSLES